MTLYNNLDFAKNHGFFVHESLFKQSVDGLQDEDLTNHAESLEKINELKATHANDIASLETEISGLNKELISAKNDFTSGLAGKLSAGDAYSKTETDSALAKKLDTLAYSQDKTEQDSKNLTYDAYEARITSLENQISSLSSQVSALLTKESSES